MIPAQVAPILGIVILTTFLALPYLVTEDSRCSSIKSKAPPQYIPISLSDETIKQYPRHKLLAYTEGAGKNVEKLKSIKFSGVPVLFIPSLDTPTSYKV